jgi:hypothetical protein
VFNITNTVNVLIIDFLKKKLENKFFIFTLSIFFFIAGYISYHTFSDDSIHTAKQFENVLHKKEKRLADEMHALAKRAETNDYNSLFKTNPAYYNQLLKQDGLALLIYENDTLKFWSDNSIAVENWIKEICLDTKVAKLNNGWFEVVHPHTNANTTKTIVGLILIKNEYPYQNKYLANEFQEDFDVANETQLIINAPDADNSVKNYLGDYLFSLVFHPSKSAASLALIISMLFSILGFVFLFVFLKKLFFAVFSSLGKNYPTVLYIAVVILIRFLSIKFFFPQSFYSIDLFNPKVFANANSIWLSSLGDMLINVILFLLFDVCFFYGLRV